MKNSHRFSAWQFSRLPKIFRMIVSLCLVFFLASSLGLSAQKKATLSPDQRSCKDFVQQFYDWYIKKQVGPDYVLKYKKHVLSARIRRELKEDYDAQAKRPDVVVDFNADPFLLTQDIANRYVAGNVTVKNHHYLVQVYAVWSGKRKKEPQVTAELVFQNGKWIFVNFRDGDGSGDLLSYLKDLREERRKNP